MLRSAIHICVILMLILQGVAQASVHVTESSPEQHCVGHEADRADCECCPDGALAANGCATLCSVIAAIPSDSVRFARIEASAPAEIATIPRLNPAYLPLTPPPIS